MSTLARRIIETAVSFARAYDACGPDADSARERVMQAGELAVERLLAEHARESVTECCGEH